MNALNCALFIILNTLSQSYLTPTTSASPQIVTTITPTVSAQQLDTSACNDARCKCTDNKVHCVMNGVTITIRKHFLRTNTTQLFISCAANTTVQEIEEAQVAYRFWHNEVEFELENCAILPEILRRANINYAGTIKFDGALTVPASLLQKAIGLQRLQVRLIVKSNALALLPSQFFNNQSALKELQLEIYCDPNEITLPSQIFHTLYGLEVISVNANQWKGIYNKTVLRNLTAEHFRDTSNLRKLDLGCNYMQTLPSELFVTLTELNELTLSKNDLSALPSGLLRAQVKLIILDLSFNQLQALPPGIFNSTPFLWHLDLSSNQFSVPTNIIAAVRPLRYLYRLDLSYNNFTHIAGAGEFENYTLLSRQHISKISATPPYFQQYLEQLSDIVYFPLPYNMTFINLSYNKIKTMNLSEKSDGLKCPYELNCDKNVIRFIYALRYLPKNHDWCRREINIYGNPLQAKNNICDWMPRNCPTACNCQYDSETLLINCTNALVESLTELPRPEQVSLTQSTLDISHNLFFELPPNVTFGYANVTRLYAAHNRLENLQSAHLPPQLEVLDVRNNSLARLSDSFIQYFLNESATLQQLYLSENPWLCDCGAKQLLNAVRTHRNRIPDVELLACANLENTSLLQARHEDVCVPESVHSAWLLFGISLVIIVFISLIALYYKYKLKLRRFM
ncbi:protein toll-like [Zeugodacus cucurbitae]|uniref:protein toll-like n=1 Tax=Zeugodacus cucurbitae TaxID=28588 RepID=UPI0023D94927|nr:protein toll-like [Zeugodacus cucurbitae]